MKIVRIALWYVLVPILALSLLAAGGFFAYRGVLQHQTREQTRIRGDGVDALEPVVLGGIRQWLLIRGTSRANPVLLFLHGGPGAADIMLARHFDGPLVESFVVVHWDQRGAGKSYSRRLPQSSLTREQFVSDLLEVARLLRGRFGGGGRIYLVGHSWGSELGLLAASRHPELFQAFIGVGQVVQKREQEEISYRYCLSRAEQDGNAEALAALRAIGPPPYDAPRKESIQRSWLERFGGVYHKGPLEFSAYVKIALASPDYTLADGLRFFRGQEFSERAMWQERLGTDLFREVSRVEVPVYFFAGRYDYNTPSELTERYYRGLEAPQGKHLVWFEDCGHMIPYEAPEEFREQLLQVLRAEGSRS